MDTKETNTLTDFVEKNQKLISILGVFAGLAVFATKVSDFMKLSKEDSFVINLISFLLFTLAIRTFVEIFRNFKDFPWYGELYFFREVFFLLMASFVWIYVKAYYPYLTLLLLMAVAMIMLVLVVGVFGLLVKFALRLPWLKNISQKMKDTISPLIALALVIACGIAVKHFIQ